MNSDLGLNEASVPAVYFSDYFNVTEKSLEDFGVLNVSLVADLPFFIDPFLLFNSKKKKYQELHKQIIAYLCFLRDNAPKAHADKGLEQAWFYFREVKQTWLGFAQSSNNGRGLGAKFAKELVLAFNSYLKNFGSETISSDSHLEKLCLVSDGVGRDMISDFVTNLVKRHLLEITQKFAADNIDSTLIKTFSVERTLFSYKTKSWVSESFRLPKYGSTYVLLCPKDLLTKDDTWISRTGMYEDFSDIPNSIEDEALRSQINEYFKSVLPKKAKEKERKTAISKVYQKFPQLVDYYIKKKEGEGDKAVSLANDLVTSSETILIHQFRELLNFLGTHTEFFKIKQTSESEVLQRINFLKDAIENKGCHRIFYNKGVPIGRESDLQILYRLTWFDATSDISREVNDGRGPVDFKASKGAKDKTLVEMKLASNKALEVNLQKQAEIYQKASDAPVAYKVILYFTDEERKKVDAILNRLGLNKSQKIITIDARSDNKPSGSKAR